ncbi:MAG: DNA translocase FtsK [Anaerolineae bacterium]
MQRQRLEAQADCLEAVLHSHKVRAQVQGGVVTPALVRFRVVPAPGVKVAQISRLSEELALALGSRACRVTRRDAFVELEFTRAKPRSVRLVALMARVPTVPPATPLLGIDADGIPMLLRLSSPDVAHILIAGTTGSGKTALARTMIASLAAYNPPSEVALALIDPKGRGYEAFAALPHLVRPMAVTAEAGLETLHWLAQEMERRDRERITLPRLVVFIDELADLVLVGGKAVEKAVLRLVQRGREAGIHVIACTQKPAATILGGLVKSNFPVRIVGSVASAEDARVATGLAGSGAERLGGRGDFLVVTHGRTYRLQAAYVAPQDIAEALNGPAKTPTRPQRTERAAVLARDLRDMLADGLRRTIG